MCILPFKIYIFFGIYRFICNYEIIHLSSLIFTAGFPPINELELKFNTTDPAETTQLFPIVPGKIKELAPIQQSFPIVIGLLLPCFYPCRRVIQVQIMSIAIKNLTVSCYQAIFTNYYTIIRMYTTSMNSRITTNFYCCTISISIQFNREDILM